MAGQPPRPAGRRSGRLAGVDQRDRLAAAGQVPGQGGRGADGGLEVLPRPRTAPSSRSSTERPVAVGGAQLLGLEAAALGRLAPVDPRERVAGLVVAHAVELAEARVEPAAGARPCRGRGRPRARPPGAGARGTTSRLASSPPRRVRARQPEGVADAHPGRRAAGARRAPRAAASCARRSRPARAPGRGADAGIDRDAQQPVQADLGGPAAQRHAHRHRVARRAAGRLHAGAPRAGRPRPPTPATVTITGSAIRPTPRIASAPVPKPRLATSAATPTAARETARAEGPSGRLTAGRAPTRARPSPRPRPRRRGRGRPGSG